MDRILKIFLCLSVIIGVAEVVLSPATAIPFSYFFLTKLSETSEARETKARNPSYREEIRSAIRHQFSYTGEVPKRTKIEKYAAFISTVILGILSMGAALWLLYLLFSINVLWGLGALVIPAFASLIALIYYEETKNAVAFKFCVWMLGLGCYALISPELVVGSYFGFREPLSKLPIEQYTNKSMSQWLPITVCSLAGSCNESSLERELNFTTILEQL